MARPDFPYRKLPCARHGIFSGASLWLGEDHLLYVKNTRFAEEYRRYYLNDIEAIYLERKARFLPPPVVTAGVSLGLIAQIVLAVMKRPFELEVGWFCLLAVAAFAGWLCVFRSCFCSIQTALGTDRLSCLHRISGSLRAIGHITDQVIAAQGPIKEYRSEQFVSQPAVAATQSRENLFGWLALPFVLISAAVITRLPVRIPELLFSEALGIIFGTVLFAVLALIAGRGRQKFRAIQGALLALLTTSGLEVYALVLTYTYAQPLSVPRENPLFSLFPMMASSTHIASIWLAFLNVAVALVTAALLIRNSSPKQV